MLRAWRPRNRPSHPKNWIQRISARGARRQIEWLLWLAVCCGPGSTRLHLPTAPLVRHVRASARHYTSHRIFQFGRYFPGLAKIYNLIYIIKIHFVARVHCTIHAVVSSTLNGCGGFATVHQPGHGPDLLSAQRLGSACQIRAVFLLSTGLSNQSSDKSVYPHNTGSLIWLSMPRRHPMH